MEYRGKHLYAEAPGAADGARRDYVAGIEDYLARLRADSAGMRDRFMPPNALKSDPESFRAEYRRMLGLDRLADPASHADLQNRFDFIKLHFINKTLSVPFVHILSQRLWIANGIIILFNQTIVMLNNLFNHFL